MPCGGGGKKGEEEQRSFFVLDVFLLPSGLQRKQGYEWIFDGIFSAAWVTLWLLFPCIAQKLSLIFSSIPFGIVNVGDIITLSSMLQSQDARHSFRSFVP